MEVISLERLGIYDLHSWFHLDVILYPILVLYYFYYFFVAYVAKYGQVSLRMKKSAKIVMKINDENSNHHLWNNRGIWWCHVTVHKPDATSERMRFSLKTKEVEKARERRDRIFAKIAEFYEIAA